jgi:hypothetical protein
LNSYIATSHEVGKHIYIYIYIYLASGFRV